MEYAVYLATEAESQGELETVAGNIGGVVIAETSCSFAVILCAADGAPLTIELTNSGIIDKSEYGGSGPIIIFPEDNS